MNDKKQETVSLGFGKIVTSKGIISQGAICLESDKIKSVMSKEEVKNSIQLDFILEELTLYPSLINSHDHLLGSYYPRVGPRRPYLTWKPWDDDLKNASVYAERGKISNLDLYYLGAYRSLISGALTVSDHIPHKINEQFIDKMPMRIIKNYSLAHEVSSYDLKWGEGIEIEHARALKNHHPFITHIEEGFDEECLYGIDYLLKVNALTSHTVLVHSLALSDDDIEKIAKYKSNVVWCPFSNYFMFGKTCRIKNILDAGINVCLGTDSPMSGSTNLLDEIKFAKWIYRENYQEEIADEILFKMVTSNAAKAFMLDNIGSLEVGKQAEFIAIRSEENTSAYAQLQNARLEDIALIFYQGEPLYGDVKYKDIFQLFNKKMNSFSIKNRPKIIAVDNPIDLLSKIRDGVGFHKELPFLPITS